MALSAKSNGTGPSALINSSWYNDFMNLLTGVMQDQVVTLKNNLSLKALSAGPTTSPTLALVAGTALGIYTYTYLVSFVSADGESRGGGSASITTTSGNQAVSLSSIPTGPTGTIKRNIYRNYSNGGTTYRLVTTLNDNTTTSYTDTVPDATVSGNALAPLRSTFGGSLIIRDVNGNSVLTLSNEGTLSALTVLGSSSLDNGNITTDGNGQLTVGNGLVSPLGNIIAKGTVFRQTNYIGGATNLELGSNYIAVANSSYLGIKLLNGTKLAEFKNNGNMIISGTTYQTSAGSVGTSSGQTFDGFDIAEVYEADRHYEDGVVVCPGDDGKLTQCSHDNCPMALIVSHLPGFCMGEIAETILPIALTGRVTVQTHAQLPPRVPVCSDGQGGVRQAHGGDYALGFTLNAMVENRVGVFLRMVKL